MKIIFGTSNNRKVEDVKKVIEKNNLPIEVLTLQDIGWDLGDIEENGKSLEENSLIKAKSIYNFCQEHSIKYTIVTDDSGLFIEALDGRPGIYTARYADEERKANPTLPKYECINKVLRELEGIENRHAYYKCVITCMMEDGSYFQKEAITEGTISKEIVEPIAKPYFYSVFDYQGINFRKLEEEQLEETYRFKALNDSLKELVMKYENNKSKTKKFRKG